MCKAVSNIVLVIVNFICLLVAAILMIVGGLIQWNPSTIQNIIPTLFKLTSNGDGQAALSMSHIAQLTTQYVNVLGNSGIIIFIIGIFLAVISLSGLIGVCCKHRCTLIIYILLTTAIFILIVIFIIVFLVYKNQLQAAMSSSFLSVLKDKYIFRNTTVNTTSGVDITGIIDLIQARVGCCGSYNGSDYLAVPNRGNYLIPYTCCIMNTTGSFTPKYSNCTTTPDSGNSYTLNGCSTYLWNIVDQYSSYAAYSLIGLAVVLFILIIMAAVLIRSFEDEKGKA